MAADQGEQEPDKERDEQEQLERDELERQIRTSKALKAMEMELQLPAAAVMPVLLRLIKTFEGKWEHIEDENYRLLADMVFQQQEAAEAESAPGSSRGRKSAKNEKKSASATPRRAGRNSKRAESDDDDDDDDHSQGLIRRSKRVPADAFTHAAGMASVERARRGRSATPRRSALPGDHDDDPAWEPPLALLGPGSRISPPQQCQSPLRRRALRRLSLVSQSGRELIDKETQTEAADFDALAHEPAAMVCYEGSISAGNERIEPPTPAALQTPAQPKLENGVEAPVFLPADQVRRQILGHVKPLSCAVCKTCEKPKPACAGAVACDPRRELVFDPSLVKIEGQAAPSSRHDTTAPMMCLNPEPLQTMGPTVPLPLPLAVVEPQPQATEPGAMELLAPEPLLLTFPLEAPPNNGIAETAGVPKVPMPCSVQSPICEPPKVLVPCSVRAPIAEVPSHVDANGRSSLKPKDAPAGVGRVESPSMKVKVEVEMEMGLSSNVKEEENDAESLPKLESTEDLISEGALAALASYISESDEEHDMDMSTKLEPRDQRTCATAPVGGSEKEGVEHGKGDLPILDDNILPTLSTETTRRDAEDSEMDVPNRDDAEQAHAAMVREGSQHSPEDTKKRKRDLIMNEQQEQGEKRKHRNDWDDISRGKEKVPIALSAPKGESFPKEFFYITSSVVFQSAHVGISMARIGEDDRCSTCVGNCLDNPTPCECARTTNGEFAYTVEGLLYPHFLQRELNRKADMKYLSFCQPGACPVERTNDEPCKGHIQRKFIKECWEKCGCSQLCGNRIVQRGIAHKLQVFWTEGGKGWGVRTLEHLPAGSFVCEFVGEILTNSEMWYRNNDLHQTAMHSFVLNIDADWNSEKILKDEEALCLDGTYYGNVSRFINHRCGDCNLFDIPVEIESPDHHYYHLAFFTSKEVNENEELTWDYGLDFNDKAHQIQAFECFCGSSLCRGNVANGNSWV